MRDPIVAEVRRHRMEHTNQCGGDLAAICADLRTVQKASGHTIVRLEPKRLPSRPIMVRDKPRYE